MWKIFKFKQIKKYYIPKTSKQFAEINETEEQIHKTDP